MNDSQFVADGLAILVSNGYSGREANNMYFDFARQYHLEHNDELMTAAMDRKDMTDYFTKREMKFYESVDKWHQEDSRKGAVRIEDYLKLR